MTFILLFTSQLTVLVNYLCALDTTFRIIKKKKKHTKSDSSLNQKKIYNIKNNDKTCNLHHLISVPRGVSNALRC